MKSERPAVLVIRNMFTYISPYKSLASVFFICLLLDLAFVSLAPLSFKFMIDLAVLPKDIRTFYLIVSALGAAGFIAFSCGIASDYALAKLNAQIQRDLRMKLFAHMQHVNLLYVQGKRSGDLLAYYSVDLPAIERAMTILLTIGIQSVTVVVISTTLLFYLQWSMALCILLGAGIIFAGPYLLGRRASKAYEEDKEQTALFTSDLAENIKAQKLIKGYHLQDYTIRKFSDRLQLLFGTNYRRNLMNAQLERIPMISLLIINLIIMGFGSYLALTDHITLGALVAFFTMYTSMGNSVFNLTFAIPAFTDAAVSMSRIQQFLSVTHEHDDNQKKLKLPANTNLTIEFDHVQYEYPNEKAALQQISLQIPAGTTTAFVGPSGSGKSTMLHLLLGFFQPSAGLVRINGMNLRDMDPGAYLNKIGVVFQETFLFQGTILDNIRVTKPQASLDEVIEAAVKADIHSFIIGLPGGYSTVLHEEGNNLSGGQRQRIAIARAILNNPALLLLDEATSGLDPISQASIQQTFRELAKERTVIWVTHDLSTIRDTDQIIVFKDGNIVEKGTHPDLLLRGDYYRELWVKQYPGSKLPTL